MKLGLAALLICSLLVGCQSIKPSATHPITNATTPMNGTTITIQGQALNSKAGAMAGKYFVDGLQAWTPEVHEKTVEVTGRLQLIEHKAEDLRAPDGSVSQGMVGTQYILRDPKWRVVDQH